MEKIFPISLMLNFTPNTSGCYWLRCLYTRAKIYKKRIFEGNDGMQFQCRVLCPDERSKYLRCKNGRWFFSVCDKERKAHPLNTLRDVFRVAFPPKMPSILSLSRFMRCEIQGNNLLILRANRKIRYIQCCCELWFLYPWCSSYRRYAERIRSKARNKSSKLNCFCRLS